ncbi:MAG TPA: FkbM family methyltransferase [Candidatus Binatia bacterium]|nr:FkbM family methyltransferase [Candidatus Binatia bacterium]
MRLCPVRFGDREFVVAVDEIAGDPIRDALKAGLFEYPPPMQSVLKWLRSDMVVVDAGAHIGTFALAAASIGARVLAFEALPSNAAMLAASAEANGFTQLEAINCALSDRNGELEFFSYGPFGLQRYAGIPAESTGTFVLAVSLDDALAARNVEHVDLIKIDIEGGELFALEGMKRLLTSPDPPALFIESNGYTLAFQNFTPNDLVARLESFGYSCYEILDRLRPFTSADFQYECVVDLFAMKGSLRDSLSPLIGAASTPDETIAGVLRNAASPNYAYRLYIVRALEGAPSAVLSHPEVVAALRRLQADPHEEVRERAGRLLARQPS